MRQSWCNSGKTMGSDDENIVNLASFRKKRRQSDKLREKRSKETQAAANRIAFGRKGGDKLIAKALKKRQKNELDGKQRIKTPDAPENNAHDNNEKPDTRSGPQGDKT
ncbi:MAG: DUF4169 family protein [Rhizobiales bacterium]|nr:DUF4169 family protein [Hyphomicrobiales bacterium]